MTSRKTRKPSRTEIVVLFRYFAADDQKVDPCDRDTALMMCEMNPAGYAAIIGVIEGIPTVIEHIVGNDRHPGHRAAIEAAQYEFAN